MVSLEALDAIRNTAFAANAHQRNLKRENLIFRAFKINDPGLFSLIHIFFLLSMKKKTQNETESEEKCFGKRHRPTRS